MRSGQSSPQIEAPVARLVQRRGLMEQEWVLYQDRLEVSFRAPWGRRRTPVDLVQVECLTFMEEAPRLLLASTFLSGVLFVSMLVLASMGQAGWAAVFLSGVLASFLGFTLTYLRERAIRVETVGGRAFVLWGGVPSVSEVERFVGLVETYRGQMLGSMLEPHFLPGSGDGEGEGLDDWGESDGMSGEEGPIDPRWIN